MSITYDSGSCNKTFLILHDSTLGTQIFVLIEVCIDNSTCNIRDCNVYNQQYYLEQAIMLCIDFS